MTNLISYVGGSQEATWVQLRNEQHSQYQLDYSADNVCCVATKSNVNGGDPCRNGLNFDNHSALQLVKRDVLHTHVDGSVLEGLYIPEFDAVLNATMAKPYNDFH